MGEVAEMMLNGDLDEWTGEYIGPGYGFPRSLDPDYPANVDAKKQKKAEKRRRYRRNKAARAARQKAP